MAWSTVLVKYGEIGIKSPDVRRRFERKLQENVEAQLVARGLQGVLVRERGRILLETPDAGRALDALAHTFGVVGASLAEPVPGDLPGMTQAAAAWAKARLEPGQTFAVRARRTGSEPYTSLEMARSAGAAIVAATGAKVDLTTPDLEVHLEARAPRAFLVTRTVAGPGGLPLGTQGRVVAAVEDARSVHALWLALRRGASATAFAWDPAPAGVREALAALAAWAPGLRVLAVPTPAAGPSRAAALAVGRRLGRWKRAYALVVGDGLPGFATLARLDADAGAPVFRPLTGFPPARLAALAERTGLPGPLDERPPAAGEPPSDEEVRALLARAEERSP